MIIIKPKIIIDEIEFDENKLKRIEKYGRVCYKSESSISENGAANFVKKIINMGHESVIEHEKVTVTFVVDRGISHEIVRHRIASYSQESTRFCNYNSEKFSNQITVIEPFFYKRNTDSYALWKKTCEFAEENYIKLIQDSTPQEARSILPNSLKTQVVVTFNFREWRHFFKLRCAKAAHPQMRQVTIPLLMLFTKRFPAIFEDINYDQDFSFDYYAHIEVLS